MWNFYTGSSKPYWQTLCVSAIAFVASVEWALRAFVAPIANTTPHLVHTIYSANGADAVIGDSHIYRAFIADDQFTHLARGGLSTLAMRVATEHYFQQRRPGRVVIGVGPQLLARPSDDTRLGDYFGQYQWLGTGLYVFEPGINNHAAWLYRPGRLQQERRRARHDLQSHGLWHEVDRVRQRQRMNQGLTEQRPIWPQPATGALGQLHELIDFLVAKGARVCLLRTPLVNAYRQLMAAHADYVRAENALHALANSSGVRYVDYQHLPIAFKDEDFLNQDHLAARSSPRFVDAVIDACFGTQ